MSRWLDGVAWRCGDVCDVDSIGANAFFLTITRLFRVRVRVRLMFFLSHRRAGIPSDAARMCDRADRSVR